MKNEEIAIAVSMAIMGILVVFNIVVVSLMGSPWNWILILPWSIVYYFYYKLIIELWKQPQMILNTFGKIKSMNKREITKMAVARVISEPGDCTRYDYLVMKFGDDYMFMPYDSTFTFPQRLNKWEVSDIETIEEAEAFTLQTAARHSRVNPHTMLECINYINKCES